VLCIVTWYGSFIDQYICTILYILHIFGFQYFSVFISAMFRELIAAHFGPSEEDGSIVLE
jgi:hypothetical protein